MATGIVANQNATQRLTTGTSAGKFAPNVNAGIITDVATDVASGSSTIHIFRTGNVVIVNCTLAISNNVTISADTPLFTLPEGARSVTALYAPVYDSDRHVLESRGVSMAQDTGVVTLRTTTATSGSIRMTLVYIAN